MTVEQLMLPRIRVEINIPNMPTFSVGDIGIYDADTDRYNMVNYPQSIEASEVKRCPETFKQLAWYEFRELSELPEYVRWLSGNVTKVLHWAHNPIYGAVFWIEPDFMHIAREAKVEPATEQEYLTYQNSQK